MSYDKWGQLENAPITNGILNTIQTGLTYGGKALGGILDFNINAIKGLTHSNTMQDLYNYNVNGIQKSINQQDLYNFAKQNGYDGTFAQFVNNQDDLNGWGTTYALEQGADNKGTWNTEFNSSFDLGKTLNSAQNIADLGLSGWSLYQNIDSYKSTKALREKRKELLEQQITNNRENMEYARKERARQDTMRSNVSAQRNSESNIRSF